MAVDEDQSTLDSNTLTEFSEEQARILVELSNMKGLSNKQLTELLKEVIPKPLPR